jgi:hypothetical protein
MQRGKTGVDKKTESSVKVVSQRIRIIVPYGVLRRESAVRNACIAFDELAGGKLSATSGGIPIPSAVHCGSTRSIARFVSLSLNSCEL